MISSPLLSSRLSTRLLLLPLSARSFSSVPYVCSKQAPLVKASSPPGFAFDIDGVLIRGQHILPEAREALSLLVDSDGNAKLPFVFLTNGGGTTEQRKAEQLSSWLNIPVHKNQVILAHSPMSMMTEYFSKRCLLFGQGDISHICSTYGFSNIVTVDQFQEAYPLLDVVCHNKRKKIQGLSNQGMDKIDAIFLMSDPVEWESALQLCVDLLQSNGVPGIRVPDQQVVFCSSNADLLWMAEHNEPRFGQGAFTLCLKTLYKEVSGRDLEYIQLGKPFPITYEYCEALLMNHAKQLGFSNVSTMYGIGDNPRSDIRGANSQANMKSVLVRTGVFNGVVNDPVDPADYVVENVLEAVRLILRLHNLR